MIIRNIVVASLGAALVAGSALSAFAAPGREGPGREGPGRRAFAVPAEIVFVRLLKAADSDRDGKITKEELVAAKDKLFEAIDANKDGTITRGELLDHSEARREELRKNRQAAAAAEQADDDGEDDDDADERGEDAGPRSEPRRFERGEGPRHGWRHHDRGPREARGFGPRRGGLLRLIDTDRNGKITKAELDAAADRLFTRFDTNKDGAISIDDLSERLFPL